MDNFYLCKVDLNRRWKETSIDEWLNQVKWSDNVRDYIKHKIQNTEVDCDGAVMAGWHIWLRRITNQPGRNQVRG